MKKIIAFVLMVTMLACTLPVAMADEISNVEISFCVGDDTLIINGKPVTVVAPYVVGDGTTLVPIRVITEAFGAKVEWNGETQNVTVTYKDTTLDLVIGVDAALLNNEIELPLLAAPELYNDGYTMVPLRFISEVFGARVGYDNATRRVTVSLKEGEKVANSYTMGDFSFTVPAGYYFIKIDDMALAYNLTHKGTEIGFLVGPTSQFFDISKDSNLIAELEKEAKELISDDPTLAENYKTYDVNGYKLFYLREGENHIYIAEKGDNIFVLTGASENNAVSTNEVLKEILNTLKY